jgi:hypothetical protein
MTHRLTNDRAAAVSLHHEFYPMATCPIATKVILLGGVATIAQWDGKNTFWRGWFPLPKAPKPQFGPPA